MKRLALILLLTGFACSAYSQTKVLDQGEELKYIVYFGFIKLGEVKIKMTKIETDEGKKTCNAIAYIKSYDGVPFVTLNNIFESEMEQNKEQLYSKKFFATEFKNKDIAKTDYRFNYDSNKVKVLKETNNKTERNETISFNKGIRFQDGLSIFYSARMNSFANKNYNIPIFINEAQSSVKYSFNINKDVVSVGAVDYDISVIKIAGVADFTGIFGLTGEFVGWFSDDEYRVPIKAQLNVLIGSITLELASYKKTNWKPPVFKH
ncbi:MAG: DUF3108 domain-containing protein [Bacteroidetes bacterium]|nr:DUF3108 domain-containing protein [Bacteroidota bacterium]